MSTRCRNTATFAFLLGSFVLGGCLGDEAEPKFISETPDPGGSANQAPTISGSPASAVKVGDSYSFTPTASDPDGDTLTFSIQNKPSWANFDTGTGRISGSPTLANVGTSSNIRVSVSDGQASASMSSFSVEVTQVSLGSASLSWTAPTQNEDGSPLTNLAGYKIYYGTSTGSYSNQIRIDNASVTTYLVENLTPDTYFFAATAFNSAGTESRYSGEAVKTVN